MDVNVKVFDQIRRLEDLVLLVEMATISVDDRDQVDALQEGINLIQRAVMELRETLDPSGKSSAA